MFILNEKLSTKIKGFLSEFCFNEQTALAVGLTLQDSDSCRGSCFGCTGGCVGCSDACSGYCSGCSGTCQGGCEGCQGYGR